MAKAFLTSQQSFKTTKIEETTALPMRLTLLILGSYILVNLLYTVLIPKGLPYDEPSHFYYVAHLAGFKNFADRGSYELAIQPPLTYLIYTPFLKIFSGAGINTQFLVLRLVSIIEGTAVVYFSLRVFNQLLGKHTQRQLILVTATTILAFNPVNIAVNSSITNDTLLELLMVLILLLTINLANKFSGNNNWKDLLFLGLLIGLAGSTKALALPFIALPCVLLLIRYVQSRHKSSDWAWFFASTLVAVIVAAPFYLSSQLLYNDPFGAIYWHNTSPQSHPFRLSEIGSFLSLTFATYWNFANFLRDALPTKPSKIEYIPFLILTICPLILWVYQSIKMRRVHLFTTFNNKQLATTTFIFLVIIGYLLKELQDFSPDGRYLFALSAPFSLLIACSIYKLVPGGIKIKRAALYMVILFVIGYSVYAALRYLVHAPNLYPNLYENMMSGLK